MATDDERCSVRSELAKNVFGAIRVTFLAKLEFDAAAKRKDPDVDELARKLRLARSDERRAIRALQAYKDEYHRAK